ncbi:MAG: superfamily and helicase [Microbacterium sp.]|nr:superfamily and helicase [Microbacterium sp.]
MTSDALEGLDEHQLEAARALRGPVCVLAGAGTGKTRVITRRIAHGVDTGAYSPQRVMAVTFTAKAAGEMRGRLRALGVSGVSARTFHAAALAQVNYFWPTLAADQAPSIIDNKVRMLAHAADGIGLSPDTATLRDVASQIEWRKVTMRSIEQYAVARPDGVGRLRVDQVVDLQRAYEKLKDERRQMDFEDVLLTCAGMIEAEPRVAAAVHEQYRHFTVDEYQDVSPLQNRLLELWLGDRRDLCVVGDASQTIYSFTGADARYLLEFERTHEDARVVRLERNYRSTGPVLAVANDLMRGRAGALELVAAREGDAPIPVVRAYDDDEAEAAGVAAAVAATIAGGTDPETIAILYRSHAQSAVVLNALAAQGIAATVLGGRKFFDLPEVRQALMALRAASVAPVETGFLATVRDVLRGVGLTDEPPQAGGALRDGWEARAALLRLAEEAPPGTNLRSFTDDLQARARDQHEPATRTVTLSTLHAAKGLEWDHVFLIGVSEGLLPISYATTFDAVDEERRLAYVGVTRAARSLSMSWARGRGRADREPSPFERSAAAVCARVMVFPDPPDRVDAQAQRTGRGPPPRGEQVSRGAGRFGGQRRIDRRARPCEQLCGEQRPGLVEALGRGIQAGDARRGSTRCAASRTTRQPAATGAVSGPAHEMTSVRAGKAARTARIADDGRSSAVCTMNVPPRRGRRSAGASSRNRMSASESSARCKRASARSSLRVVPASSASTAGCTHGAEESMSARAGAPNWRVPSARNSGGAAWSSRIIPR